MKQIYIAGKITNNPNYMQEFASAERTLTGAGFLVMNPTILPEGFGYEQYMKICFSMIDVCDTVVLLDNWEQSSGARRERNFAIAKQKNIYTFYEFIAWMISSGKMPPGLASFEKIREFFHESIEGGE